MIKIQIVKTEKNEKFDEEMKVWQETFDRRNRGGYDRLEEMPPQPEKTFTVLQVVITEEQWEAIRKAVIEKF